MVAKKLEFDLTDNAIKETRLISNDTENPFDLQAPIATDTLNRRLLSLTKIQFNWVCQGSVSLVLTNDKGEVFQADGNTLNKYLCPSSIPLPPPPPPVFASPNRPSDVLQPFPDPKSPLGSQMEEPLTLDN